MLSSQKQSRLASTHQCSYVSWVNSWSFCAMSTDMSKSNTSEGVLWKQLHTKEYGLMGGCRLQPKAPVHNQDLKVANYSTQKSAANLGYLSLPSTYLFRVQKTQTLFNTVKTTLSVALAPQRQTAIAADTKLSLPFTKSFNLHVSH